MVTRTLLFAMVPWCPVYRAGGEAWGPGPSRSRAAIDVAHCQLGEACQPPVSWQHEAPAPCLSIPAWGLAKWRCSLGRAGREAPGTLVLGCAALDNERASMAAAATDKSAHLPSLCQTVTAFGLCLLAVCSPWRLGLGMACPMTSSPSDPVNGRAAESSWRSGLSSLERRGRLELQQIRDR